MGSSERDLKTAEDRQGERPLNAPLTSILALTRIKKHEAYRCVWGYELSYPMYVMLASVGIDIKS